MRRLSLSALVILALLALSCPAFSAQVVSETVTHFGTPTGDMKRLNIAWTSHTDGTVSYTTSSYQGIILFAETDPAATSPTALYDVTVTTATGVDVFADGLLNRSATATETARPYAGAGFGSYPVSGALTIAVTGAGNAKQGTLYLYYTTEPSVAEPVARIPELETVLASTTELSAGAEYTSAAIPMFGREGFLTVYADQSAYTTAAELDIKVLGSVDGETWAYFSDDSAPNTALSVATDLTSGGGPNNDGEFIFQYAIPFCQSVKVETSNSGSGTLTSTVKALVR